MHISRSNRGSKSGSRFAKDNSHKEELVQIIGADDFEGVLPATAGAIACPLGARCCSFVGNGLGGLPLAEGVSGIVLPPVRS